MMGLGLVSNFRRLFAVGGAIAILIGMLAPLSALALNEDELGSLRTDDDARAFFGEDVDSSHYKLLPDPFSEDADADKYGVILCGQDETNCADEGVRFMLREVHHSDRGGGEDTYDFRFLPVVDGQPVTTSPLKIIYRKTHGSRHSSGLVWGETNDGADVMDNKVADLEGFNDSALVDNFLEAKADKNELEDWTAGTKVNLDSSRSGFFERAQIDPFAEAIQKMGEAVASLTKSVGSALKWAMSKAEINDVNGLNEAWLVVRDLVNLLFTVVLVALALMTILRIDPPKYGIRSTLPLLIFAIVAVNFSFLFAQTMLNTASVVSQPFLQAGMDLIDNGVSQQSGFTASDGSNFGEALVLLAAAIIMLIAMVFLLVFFLIRVIVVWLLAAMSPVLFLFMVLPLTRGESKKLLQSWIRWVYMAPVALLILFIGGKVAFPTDLAIDDEGAEAILRALFYAGVVLAAAFIPVALGGTIMNGVLKQGGRAGRLSGKGALGAASIIPAGGGKSAAQRLRTGKAFMEQRKASLEQAANLDAANARLAMADQPFGAALTGFTDGQQIAAQEQMVFQAEKEQTPLGMPAKFRIAHAWQFGTETDAAGNVYALDNTGARWGGANAMAMSDIEQKLARNRISAAAAYKQLASADLSERYMLEKAPNTDRSFAWSGYQQLHRGDPRISSVELNGKLNRGSMKIKSHHFTNDDIKGLDTTFLKAAQSGDKDALDSLREIDAVRLGDAANADHRNKFSTAEKQDIMYQIAEMGLLSRGLTGDAQKLQQNREEVIKNSYLKGREQVAGKRAAPDFEPPHI